jgi:hypothetical protein
VIPVHSDCQLHEQEGPIVYTMSVAEEASSQDLAVCVTDDFAVSAGSWHRGSDGHDHPIAHIDPAVVPMFLQVVQYLERQPEVGPGGMRLADEARAAAAVCIRFGSYFAVLTGAARPLCPDARDETTSHIDDDEIARMNIEISAAIEWWFSLKGSEPQRYGCLVQRALRYLPPGRKTVGRSPHGDRLWACALGSVAAEVGRAWHQERLERDLQLGATHPVRVIANSTTLQSWRNGPIENVHAGTRSVGHRIDERRVLPRDESAIMRQAQDGLYGALRGVESLMFDGAWPPPPDRVLPFLTPFLYPSGWSCTEQSRAITLPLRAAGSSVR